jgi:hypothetical protein
MGGPEIGGHEHQSAVEGFGGHSSCETNAQSPSLMRCLGGADGLKPTGICLTFAEPGAIQIANERCM